MIIKSAILFDRISGKIFLDDAEIGRLNYSERLVFDLLIKEKNEIVHKDALLSAGWPNRIVVPNSLSIAIRNIRNSLERAGIHNEPETIPKKGYRLSVDIGFINNEINSIPSTSGTPLNDATLMNATESTNINPEASELDDKKLNEILQGYKLRSPLKPELLKGVYFCYLFSVFSISVYSYGARLFSEPDFVCRKYDAQTFCGAHDINLADIPSDITSNDNSATYWFSERNNEFIFFKVD